MGIPRHPRPRFNSIVAQVRPRVSASVGACFVVAFTFIGVRLVSLIENPIDGLAEDQRRARFLFIACLMLSLSGCATLRSTNNELDSYVGRSVSEVAGKLGPPTTKFDLGDGRRSFDWENYGGCNYSVIANTRTPGSPSLADWKVESWQQTAGCLDVQR